MKPGKELDLLIAKHVMKFPEYMFFQDMSVIPDFSTDIKTAWEVVDKLISDGRDIEIRGFMKNDPSRWQVVVDNAMYELGETASHAICLAALKATGGKSTCA